MENPIEIVRAEDIRAQVGLAYGFTKHPMPEGQPSPFHKHFCSKCFGMISRAIGSGDYETVIRNMGEPLLDHLQDFLTSAGEQERCDLLKAQRAEVAQDTSPARLEASRAEYLEVVKARHYGFDINNEWHDERGDWLEAKRNLPTDTKHLGVNILPAR